MDLKYFMAKVLGLFFWLPSTCCMSLYRSPVTSPLLLRGFTAFSLGFTKPADSFHGIYLQACCGTSVFYLQLDEISRLSDAFM